MEIVLNPTWQEYKQLRLLALETDPKAFGSSLEEERLSPDEKWQKYLNHFFVSILVLMDSRVKTEAGPRIHHHYHQFQSLF